MKNINETVKSKYLIYILFLAGGLLLGWLLSVSYTHLTLPTICSV